jgi:multicomponent Na+:H+ antiporter subunit B
VSRPARLAVFVLGALALAFAYVVAAGDLPEFGTESHPYGDRAVHAAVSHRTANAVTSLAFDQRAFDTLGEESILVLAVVAGTVLLRRLGDESETEAVGGDDEGGLEIRRAETSEVVRLIGYLVLPVTLVVGGYLVAHGALSPGGGFQGGVAIATAIHLLYVAGDYAALERIRPVQLFEAMEAAALTAYVALGAVAIAAASAFLTNVLPWGSYQTLLSAGTVDLLNVAAGVAVLSGVVVLLSEFLHQTLLVSDNRGADD